MRAVQIERTGGPEVLTVVDLPTPTPGPGQVLIQHHAVGLNFIDTYQRTGLYPIKLPAVLGLEAAGVVEAVGEGVVRLSVGDRVAYQGQAGAYAAFNVVRADRAVKLPRGVSFETAAACLLKGLTAEMLARRLWPLGSGDVVLVHAAAGGVGSILVQWLTHLGVAVIATVGTEAKAELARRHGAEHVLLTDHDNVPDRVKEITGGRGVKVAFDSVGRTTLDASLASLAPRGLFASYGNASGPAGAVEPLRLSRGGSLFMTRPGLFDYVARTEELDAAAAELWRVIESGAVKIAIGQTFPLTETRAAHEALEGRRTTGATVLIP